MARVTLPMGIVSISGKVGDVCFRTMKKTGTVYMAHLPRARKIKYSTSELEAMENFSKRAKLVAQLRNAGSQLSRKELWRIASQVL